GWPGTTKVLNQLWQIAEAYTPEERPDDYTQAMMDLGATLCTPRKPNCLTCPLQSGCQALAQGRVEEIPGSRPKKQIPERKCQLTLIVNGAGEILLERRPPSGIWGGLWCLPQVDEQSSDEEILQQWRQRLGIELELLYELSPIRHTFSHFHLTMRPRVWRLTANPVGLIRDEPDLDWYAPNRPPPGLPAPIKKLLKQYPKTMQLALLSLNAGILVTNFSMIVNPLECASCKLMKGRAESIMSRTVYCKKYQKETEGLGFPPMPGAKGQDLYNNVSKQAWQEWLQHQT